MRRDVSNIAPAETTTFDRVKLDGINVFVSKCNCTQYTLYFRLHTNDKQIFVKKEVNSTYSHKF